MKIVWVVDVWPPVRRPGRLNDRLNEERDADGDWIESAAHELAAQGDEVLVVAGVGDTSAGPNTASRRAPRVHILARSDVYREHWQRSASVSVSSAFRELVRAERPDVVHVHHWRGLTRDLVYAAALEGRPAVISLHDLWTTCLIHTRILPVTQIACDAPFAAHPCLACAARVPPRTPWVPIEAQHMAFAEHKAEIVRELRLARAVLVRDREHGAALRRFLGEDAAPPAPFQEIQTARSDVRALIEIHSAAAAAGAPEIAHARERDWYTLRMKAFAEAEWERCARAAMAAGPGSRGGGPTSGAEPSP